ncbi:hypothetical protein [Puniceicoccus vermicola]|uniref:Sigma-70 family RNA polymerase sigma factor n=1 Tax=Puniceicoccus vermicola TaxID=388746 RepID=A0A7X1AXZ3_9BACT|nr:hypothetical protein [Puniceicoccus vermicola]MBC2602065.1 hypothetical protein [Puniceicoccus vermicola]
MRISNREFLGELRRYYENDVFSPCLGVIITDLIGKTGSRKNFKDYSYLDEMKGYALERCINAVATKKFDINTRKNPVSYFYSTIYNSFLKYIKKEKQLTIAKKAAYEQELERIERIRNGTPH